MRSEDWAIDTEESSMLVYSYVQRSDLRTLWAKSWNAVIFLLMLQKNKLDQSQQNTERDVLMPFYSTIENCCCSFTNAHNLSKRQFPKHLYLFTTYFKQGTLSRSPSEELLLVEGWDWGGMGCGLAPPTGVGKGGACSPSGVSTSFISYNNRTSSICHKSKAA